MWAIQYLGRWGGDSVRLYTAQAFAVRYGQLSLDVAAARAARRTPIDAELRELPADARAVDAGHLELDGAREIEEVLGEGVPAILGEALAGAEPLREAAGGEAARYVTNRGTGVTHRVPAGWHASQPRGTWRAACGWAFSGDGALLTVELPRGPWCKRHGCFKDCPPPGEDSDSGDSE